MKELLDRLLEEFNDREYAHAYMESHAVSRLAAQVYAIRKMRGWSQEELAKESGIAQERISKIESADFDSLTITTLKKLSRAFDVSLRVAFQPFNEGMLDVVNMTPQRLEVKTREVSLAEFRDNCVRIDRDGNLISVDTTYLAPVQTIGAASEVDETSSSWQPVLPSTASDSPSKVAV